MGNRLLTGKPVPNKKLPPAAEYAASVKKKDISLFMKLSGLILIILVLGHVFIMVGIADGIARVDAEFVRNRLRQPFWKLWDILMLWLALLHGGNGMRDVISDYYHQSTTKNRLIFLLLTSLIIIGGLGTYTVVTI